MPLTVACVLSKVVQKDRTYDRSHVERLAGMVEKHMGQPYRFVCVDDSDFPGWWAKIDLFRPGRFTGRVLYFDLDVDITGQIDDLANHPGEFVICRDWGSFGYNSSVMAWDAGTADDLYTDFRMDMIDKYPGDQDWITVRKAGAAKFPRDWCYSYRLGLKTGFPKDMRVCVYHGSPKPWEIDG